MSLARRHVAALLFAALAPAAVVACTKDNPNACQGAACGADAAVDAPPVVVGCDDDPDLCTTEQSCLANACVDCEDGDNTQSADCTTAAAPICTAAHTCRACADDRECDSRWCEAGACIPSENIVYVKRGQPDADPCTQAQKCGSPTQGMSVVTATRKYMIIEDDPAAYVLTAGALAINKDVVIHGTGAILERAANEIVLVTGGEVEIRGLTIRGATGGANADGIRCSTSAKLTLRSVSLIGNEDRGIDSSTCILDLDRTQISGSGVNGIRVANGRFSIRNSFFFGNGSLTSQAGGLFLNPDAVPNTLESNTIIKNTADTGGGKAGGVVCSGATPITARNNLVYGSINASREVDGNSCTHSYSVIGAANPPAGTMVRSLAAADLGLTNPNGASLADFHINPTANPPSMLRAGADPATPASVDFDGDARPNPAGAADIGADEVP
jgi:hypothetical protein